MTMVPFTTRNTRWASCFLAAILFAPGHGMAAYTFEGAFGGSGTQPGQFSEPRGAAIDGSGNVVITEAGNDRVQICTDQGSCTAFGSFGTLSGEFDRPRGVTVASSGRIFIADRGNERIQDCDASGICLDFDGSPPLAVPFDSPRDVEMMPDGRVVIADTNNNRIVLCDTTGSACTSFGSFGTQVGRFNEPTGLAVDSQGRIIIADRNNHRIQVCNETGTTCSAFGSFGSAAGQFSNPADIDIDSQDNIVIADRFNDRIQVCSDQGACTAFGSIGTANGQFIEPWGVTVDAQDRIFVVDSGNDRIQVFSDDSVALPVSIDSFTATPTTLFAGDSTTVSWSVSNATACTASGDWGGSKNANGGSQQITLSTAGGFTFNLNCTGDGDPDSASVSVTVNAIPPVNIDSFTAVPSTLAEGDSTTVSWSVSNATACTASGDWSGAKSATGGNEQVTLETAGSYSFILNCTGDGDPDSASVSVTVNAIPAVSIDSLTAMPQTIEAGASTTLMWSVSNATTCTALGGTGPWSGNVEPETGSLLVQIDTPGNYLFTLQCTDGNSSDERSVEVAVTETGVPFVINSGVNDAWFNPDTAGQGFLVVALPSLKFMFVAWFTFEAGAPPAMATSNIGVPEHRWITAAGPYDGNTAVLDIEITSGGVFSQSEPEATQVPDGTLTIVFDDCNTAVASYAIPSLGLTNDIPIERIVPDNAPLCEALQPVE